VIEYLNFWIFLIWDNFNCERYLFKPYMSYDFMPIGMCVGRTFNLEEAKALADRYEARGFDTQILDRSKAGIVLYEVWAQKKKEGMRLQ